MAAYVVWLALSFTTVDDAIAWVAALRVAKANAIKVEMGHRSASSSEASVNKVRWCAAPHSNWVLYALLFCLALLLLLCVLSCVLFPALSLTCAWRLVGVLSRFVCACFVPSSTSTVRCRTSTPA